jgi:hypothetical protein
MKNFVVLTLVIFLVSAIPVMSLAAAGSGSRELSYKALPKKDKKPGQPADHNIRLFGGFGMAGEYSVRVAPADGVNGFIQYSRPINEIAEYGVSIHLMNIYFKNLSSLQISRDILIPVIMNVQLALPLTGFFHVILGAGGGYAGLGRVHATFLNSLCFSALAAGEIYAGENLGLLIGVSFVSAGYAYVPMDSHGYLPTETYFINQVSGLAGIGLHF